MTFNDLKNWLGTFTLDKPEGFDLLVKGIDVLATSLDSPLGDAVKTFCPPVAIFTGLIKAISKINPDVNTCFTIALQQAYLKSLVESIPEYKKNQKIANKDAKKKLQEIIKTAKSATIDVTTIDFRYIQNEPIIKDYLIPVAITWLETWGVTESKHEAKNLAQSIAYRTYPILCKIVAENPKTFDSLKNYLSIIDFDLLDENKNIEFYKNKLHEYISKPYTVLKEPFALKDIYIELNATELIKNPKKEIQNNNDSSVNRGETKPLTEWVLNDLNNSDQIFFIQGDPGMGKSIFCRSLAAKIVEEHSDWIPVLIKLSDGFKLDCDIEDAIFNAVRSHFNLNDELLRKQKFVFILDGFDELVLSGTNNNSLKYFFDRLSKFRQTCDESQRKFKIVLTGRPMRIKDVYSEIPNDFFRLEIDRLDTPLINKWLSNWKILFGEEETESFTKFLKVGGTFGNGENSDIGNLAKEPLLLYMLATMHRNGAISEKILKKASRIKIYDCAVCWATGDEEYDETHRKNEQLKRLDIQPKDLRELLKETSLCIFHSGELYASIEKIKRRLKNYDSQITDKLFESNPDKETDAIYTILAEFYFKKNEKHTGNVEFIHRSFGEYLTAERMADMLIQIGKIENNKYTYKLETIAQDFYDIFLPQIITREIQEFVMDILKERLKEKSDFKSITDRLYRFYIEFSNGRWIDEGCTKKAMNDHDIKHGLLKSEAIVAINLFTLLCLLYKELPEEEKFIICGSEKEFDQFRFRRLIGLCELIGPFEFISNVGRLLENINLRGADLRFADLVGADLRGTDLVGANLVIADLRGTDLVGAYLWDADLRGADLRGANCKNMKIAKED